MPEKILHLRQDARGKYYVPDLEEARVLAALDFHDELRKAYEATSFISQSSKPLSLDTLFAIMPEWLRDAILSIGTLFELVVAKLMRNGRWVKIRWFKVGMNFTLLVAVISAIIEIIKHWKTDGSGRS